MIYYRNDVRDSSVSARKLKATLQHLLSAVGEEDTSISLSLIDDNSIKKLNRLHRDKNKATDVLSFPQREEHTLLREPPTFSKKLGTTNSFGVSKKRRSRSNHGRLRRASLEGVYAPPLGDIVISVETARRQAAEYDAPLERELERLMIHGLLHLLGHDHERPAERKVMEAEERRLAACIGMPWPYDA